MDLDYAFGRMRTSIIPFRNRVVEASSRMYSSRPTRSTEGDLVAVDTDFHSLRGVWALRSGLAPRD